MTGAVPASSAYLQSENSSLGEPVVLSWMRPLGLIGLSFWNFLARVLTLGIYHFWGKTEVRKRLWSAIRINGEPLVYTGRGLELFLGFLIVFFLILLPLLLIPVAAIFYLGPESTATKVVQLLLYVVFFYLFGVAVYRAQRYRMSRTTWRGIRGQLVGNPWQYAWTSFWTGLLVPLTLGWILPWRAVKLQKFITNDTRIGNRSFLFEGSSKPLYVRFAILWFSAILIYLAVMMSLGALMFPSLQEIQLLSERGAQVPTMTLVKILATVYGGLIIAFLLYSIASAWYRARMINHFASCTKFENLKFSGSLQARGLVYMAVTNFFIRLTGSLIFLVIGIILAFWAYGALSGMSPPDVDPLEWDKTVRGITVALATGTLLFAMAGFVLFAPVTEARNSGYLINRISIDGTAALAEIEQGAKQDIKLGEGLAEAFDIDAF